MGFLCHKVAQKPQTLFVLGLSVRQTLELITLTLRFNLEGHPAAASFHIREVVLVSPGR